MAYRTNDSTVLWDSTAITNIASIDMKNNSAKIDVSVLGDTQQRYETGTSDYEFSLTCVGNSQIPLGDIASFDIIWTDGVQTSFDAAVCIDVSASGSLNGRIESKVVICPSNAVV